MIKNESPQISLLRPLLHAAALLLAGVLLPFVWLREEPQFWTNAGGYPVWFRDLVRLAYYPLLLGYVGMLPFLSWLWMCRPSRSVKLFCVEGLLLALLWLVLAFVVTLMLANNISNLIEGRALHAH